MVFADVVAEEIDALVLFGGVCVVGGCGCGGGEGVEMGASEHVRFAYRARRNGDCGYRGVEFRVGGGEEELVEDAAYFVCWEHRNVGHLRAGGEAGVQEDGGSR